MIEYSSKPNCNHYSLVCPAILWADDEINRLRTLNAELMDALSDMVEIVEDIPHYAGRARAASQRGRQ